jgi:transposase
LLLGLVNSTISDVACKQGLSYDEVEGVIKRYVAGTVDWSKFSSLPVIGLDEIALKKGHKDYVVIVSTQQADGSVGLLGVLKNREKATVAEFLRSIPARLRETISDVCSDMYEGFVNAAKEELSQARIVIDRFHVAKSYRECADQMRKRELRDLKMELGKNEYSFLKGTMWPFRKDPEKLTKEERQDLALLLRCSSELKTAYEMREELTAIFDTDQTKT